MFEEYLYTDASIKKNGQPGQDSEILITDEFGEIKLRKHLGDYTTSEAELLGVLACLKLIAPNKKIKIHTDSMVVTKWCDTNPYKHNKNHATTRAKQWAIIVREMLVKTGSELKWVSRWDNLAGQVYDKEK